MGTSGGSVGRVILGVAWLSSGLLSSPCFGQGTTPTAPAPKIAAPEQGSDPELQDYVSAEVGALVRKHGLPALAVRVVIDGKLAAVTSQGVRRKGFSEPVANEDRWSLGAATESITAAAIGRLADDGILDLDASLEKALPKPLADVLDPGLRNATLAQLLAHTAGLDDAVLEERVEARPVPSFAGMTVEDEWTRQAWQVSAMLLSHQPASEPGSAYRVSHIGYVVAALIAVNATGQPWRELVAERVCRPLEMNSFGFGAPGLDPESHEPAGHAPVGRSLVAVDADGPVADDPLYLDPATRMSMSLPDLERFLESWTAGLDGKSTFLRPATFERLFAVSEAKDAEGFAHGVFIERDRETGSTILSHSGCNTLWRCAWRYDSKERALVLLASNCGNEDSDHAFHRCLELLDAEFAIRASRRADGSQDK